MSTYDYEEELKYQRINRFFVEQISRLETPIIDSRPNCVTIGPYRVITNKKIFEVWRSKSHLYDFYKRNWGVGYAMSLYKGYSNTARQLIDFNKKYENLDNKKFLFEYHINNARRQNDHDRLTVFKNRLSRVESELYSLEHHAGSILKSLQV